MSKQLFISPSPHTRGNFTTQRLMRDVLIALLPAFVFSVWVYGFSALWITVVAVSCCVAFEYLIQRFMLKGPLTLTNYSAIVTGVLLAFNLPSSLPLWMVAVGSLVAIGVGKMSFGGLGCNPFNPALVGRVFLLISFPVQMTLFPLPGGVTTLGADALSGPTLLGFAKGAMYEGLTTADIAAKISYTDLLWGFRAGSFGEIAAVALLLGFVYLLMRKVITWHIPLFVLGSMALFSAVMWKIDPLHYMNPLFHLLTGGALLGAIYMATDYSTSPMTHKGMAIYGVGIGVITMMIRYWGAYPEGVSFAILIMNAVVPLINKFVKPKRFGVVSS